MYWTSNRNEYLLKAQMYKFTNTEAVPIVFRFDILLKLSFLFPKLSMMQL